MAASVNLQSLPCSFKITDLGESQQKYTLLREDGIVQTVDNIRFLFLEIPKDSLQIGGVKRCKKARHIEPSGELGQSVARLVTKSAKYFPYKTEEEYRCWAQSLHRHIERANQALERLKGVNGVIRQYACIKTIHKDQTPKYVVFQAWCKKGDLYSLMERKQLFVGEKHRIASNLLRTLTDMHAFGVYHRDLKLENILIDWDGNPIITDFDMAYTAPREDQPVKNELDLPGCTIAYLSPERAAMYYRNVYENEHSVTTTELDLARNDVWGMGMILHCLYHGGFPHALDNVLGWEDEDHQLALFLLKDIKGQIVPHRWDPIDQLISEMLCTDPAMRITAEEAFIRLQEIL